MRRLPNPWIAVPALALGLLAGALGWVVTDVSCRQQDLSAQGAGCPGWAAAIAVIAFVAVTVSVALVLVLVYRSLGEWRERSQR
jgi:hypothetical protein